MPPKLFPSTTADFIFTPGKLLGDGTLLDLVANPDTRLPELLFWSKGKATMAPQIRHGGRTYRPIELDPTMVRAVRWPTKVGKFETTAQIFNDLLKMISCNTDLPDHDVRLVAYFVLSTWMAEWLPMVPSLAILGTYTSEAIQLLSLLDCLCRRPILIANLSHADLLSLPPSLGPTFLLDRPRLTPAFQHFLSCTNRRGAGFLRNGELVELCASKAMFIGMDALPKELGGNTIQIALPVPSKVRPILNAATMDLIAEEFQPKLFAYRLANYCKLIAPPPVVGCTLDHDTTELANSLGTCIVDDPGLAAQVFPLLQAQNDAARGDAEAQFDEWVAESILACLHAKMPRVLVKEITKSVNTISIARGEIFEFNPEDVGRRLRSLGLFTKRAASGKFLQLDRATSILVHRMARQFDILTLMKVVKGCPDCNPTQPIEKKPPVHDMNEVHL